MVTLARLNSLGKNWIYSNMKWLTNLFKSNRRAKSKTSTEKKELTAKELATSRGEAYVTIVRLDIDPENLHEGSFELDWNDKFVSDLVRHGYMMREDDTDADIVDRWFSSICRHVVLETFEQYEAMNIAENRVIKQRNLGDGRSEVS